MQSEKMQKNYRPVKITCNYLAIILHYKISKRNKFQLSFYVIIYQWSHDFFKKITRKAKWLCISVPIRITFTNWCQKTKILYIEISHISQKYNHHKRCFVHSVLLLYLPSSVTVEWLRSVTDTCLLVFRTGTSLFFESKRYYL